MRHAKTIKAGDLSVGSLFTYDAIERDKETGRFGAVERVGKVESIRKTKTGRIKFEIHTDGDPVVWSHGPIVSHRMMQE